jgi:hypothetical protein
MTAPDRWIAHLKCGHEARLRGEPQPGQWITCIAGKCQGQRRVDRVTPVREVPAPGEPGIQGTLWEAA